MYRLFRLLLLLIPFFSFSQIELSTQARVSVLTCDTGTEIYSLFGHTAIRVKDPASALDIVFNYGAFDFSTPNFGLRFAKGDLQYFVTAESFDEFLMQYHIEKRSVWEQELQLTTAQKSELFSSLTSILQTDERFYTYKFIDRNCTNMAVNMLNTILDKPIIVKRNVDDRTYRDIIFPYFDRHFFEQWGTSILFGTKVDEQATTLFLPSELMHSLAVTRIDGMPLAYPAKTILEAEKQQPPLRWFNSVGMYTLLLLPVLFFHRRRGVQYLYFTVISLLGLTMIWTMFFSLHEELRSNYNILLFNPLLIVTAWLDGRNRSKSAYLLSIVCLALLVIYTPVVVAKAHFWIVLPLILINGLMLYRIFKGNKD